MFVLAKVFVVSATICLKKSTFCGKSHFFFISTLPNIGAVYCSSMVRKELGSNFA